MKQQKTKCFLNLQNRFRRKAQGLPITTIVILVIALLVLAVIAYIFISRSGIFSETLKSCTSQGGQCKTTQCTLEEASLTGTDCKKGEYCCIPIG